MRFYKIHLYVRCHLIEEVERALLRLGVSGFSCCRVKGAGEYVNYFEPDHLVEHARVEVFLSEDKVQPTVDVLLDAACTNAAGDGIIAVMPVESIYRIRDKKEIVDTLTSP